jgi:hypothetical protein
MVKRFFKAKKRMGKIATNYAAGRKFQAKSK